MEKKWQKNISYRPQFISSKRFMASSLSNLANNLVKGIHKTKYTNCNTCFLNTNAKNDLIEYKCLCCNELPKKSLIKT